MAIFFFFFFFFWGGYFCGYMYFWGFTSNFDNFYGLLFKINYCNVCSVMKFILTHTTTIIKHIMGKVIYDDVFRFCQNFKYFWGTPDIFGGNLSSQVFWGYRVDAGAQPM